MTKNQAVVLNQIKVHSKVEKLLFDLPTSHCSTRNYRISPLAIDLTLQTPAVVVNGTSL